MRDTLAERATDRRELEVEGMTCASCVRRVERALERVPGVDQVSVNLSTERAVVSARPEVANAALERALEQAGYGVRRRDDARPIRLQVTGMTCASCVRRVERALTAVPGVEHVSVNLATEIAEVIPSGAVSSDALLAALRRAGYDAVAPAPRATGDASDERRTRRRVELRRRQLQLLTAGVLSGGVLVAAYGFSGAAWSNAVQLVLTLPVYLWTGAIFHKGALRALRHRTANMDTLVSMGSTVALLYSVVATFALHGEMTYYDVAALIITLIAVGKYLEVLARGKAGAAIEALAGMQPRTAHRIQDGDRSHAVDVDVDDLVVDDELLVRPGERIPTDGVLIAGAGTVDESMITGESMPVEKAPQAELIGGTVNGLTPLHMRVTRTGRETMLSQIVDLVERAQSEKPPVQRLADRASSVFVPVVIGLAAATFVGWLATGHGIIEAMITSVAVLVVACPCALGLATPVAITASSGRGAELGLLIRGGETLERIHRLRAVVLDKTGTLTAGRPEVVDAIPLAEDTVEHGLRLAAAVETASEHPLAAAIVRAAGQRGGDVQPEPATDVVAHPGGGVVGTVGGLHVLVGSPRWLEEQGVDLEEAVDRIDRLASQGGTVVGMAVDGRPRLLIGVADPLRADGARGVERLRALGLHVALATGDTPQTAAAIATAVGIDDWHAQLRPADKAALVAQLRTGGPVAMVGDGVNDAPALAVADVGIAIGSGTGIAMAASAITLVHGDVGAVADAIALSRATLRIIRQNLAWAFGYNLVLVPLAMVHLIPPVFAALAMALSSVTVVTNALRLRQFGRTRTGPGAGAFAPTGATPAVSISR